MIDKKSPILCQPVLAVAADLPCAADAIALAEALVGLPVWLKVGLELFTAEGPPLIHRLGEIDLPLFLDLKFHDIPNTVRSAVRSASHLGVSMLTVHLSGGEAMCKAAIEGRDEARATGGATPLIVGVTVLTSQGGDADLFTKTVVERALQAKKFGLDGVVCSGLEAGAVKASCGRDFACVCPGIRFAGAKNDDQARVCTPEAGVLAGANMLVMGRPIVCAKNQRQEAMRALALMKEAFTAG